MENINNNVIAEELVDYGHIDEHGEIVREYCENCDGEIFKNRAIFLSKEGVCYVNVFGDEFCYEDFLSEAMNNEELALHCFESMAITWNHPDSYFDDAVEYGNILQCNSKDCMYVFEPEKPLKEYTEGETIICPKCGRIYEEKYKEKDYEEINKDLLRIFRFLNPKFTEETLNAVLYWCGLYDCKLAPNKEDVNISCIDIQVPEESRVYKALEDVNNMLEFWITQIQNKIHWGISEDIKLQWNKHIKVMGKAIIDKRTKEDV